MVSAADLPEDVLQAVQRSLPLVSYVRFSAVCASWRSAAARNPHPPRDYDSPWLFSLRGGDKLVAVRISPKNDGPPHYAYQGEIPEEFRGHHLVISCLEGNNNNNNSILIEHPQKRDGIHLVTNPFSSSWTSAYFLPSRIRCKIDLNNFIKIVKHGDTAVAIAGALSGELVYTTPRFDHWISPDEIIDLGGFVDLVLRKEDGRFYALSNACDMVLSLDFKPSSEIDGHADDVIMQNMTLNLRPGRDPHSKEYPGWCCFQDGRLVDSPSAFFLVRWRMLYKRGEPTEREIDVYKLLTGSAGEKNWVLIDSLDDNYSFFLGDHQSMAVSTEDFPELKSNCIYLLHDAAFIAEYGSFEIEDYMDDVEYNLIYDMKHNKWDYWDEYEGWDDSEGDAWPSMWMMPPPLGQPPLKRH